MAAPYIEGNYDPVHGIRIEGGSIRVPQGPGLGVVPDRSILPCCLPYGKAGGLQILCCQGINVTDYNFNLDALALKPSDFCNVRVNCYAGIYSETCSAGAAYRV